MLIEIKIVEHIDRFGRRTTHDVFCLKCDGCGKLWEKRGSRSVITKRKAHTCSVECMRLTRKSDGVIGRSYIETCVERYGVVNTFASEKCKETMRETWKKNYGVDHPWKSELIRQKSKASFVEHYGVENPAKASEVKEKIAQTMLRRHGVKHPMQLKRVRDAMMKGVIEKYGVKNHMSNPEHAREILRKRAKEGTLYQSKPENAFNILLCEYFGENDIERQHVSNNGFWSIDFYIKSIDTYVQFDGVYWHGLDRPIDVIKESGISGHIRDMNIYRKWCVDRQQEKWFRDNDLRLVRVTDREFKEDPEACILKIKGDLSGKIICI